MRPTPLLFSLLFVFFVSCNSEEPANDTVVTVDSPMVSEPAPPDPHCLKEHERAGSLTGEWMESGKTNGIVSETDCFTLDTTGFSTRRERQWVFQNDSMFYALSKDGGRAYYFKLNAARDTLFMVDDHHMFHDTLRITRFDEQYLIVASENESVLYMKRK